MEQTKRTDFTNGIGAARYGCFNRPPLKGKVLVPDTIEYIEWYVEGQRPGSLLQEARIFKEIPFRMSTDCKYDRSGADERCAGCKHAKPVDF